MEMADRYGGRMVLTALAVVLSAVACLPIKHSYMLSPGIVGSFQLVDGHPGNGSFELATGRMGDSTCTTTTLQAQIDSAGMFHFAPQEIRSNWTPLIPFDAVASVYSLCYRSAGIAREVYRGIALRGTVSDSITCLATPRADTLAVQCRGQSPMPHLR
jgi:hypothetical protein